MKILPLFAVGAMSCSQEPVLTRYDVQLVMGTQLSGLHAEVASIQKAMEASRIEMRLAFDDLKTRIANIEQQLSQIERNTRVR